MELGLNNYESKKVHYLKISRGEHRLSEKVPEGTEGARMTTFTVTQGKDKGKVIKTPKLFYPSVAGFLTGINIITAEYDGRTSTTLSLTIETEKEKFIVQDNHLSDISLSMYNTLPNIDLTQPVKLSVYSDDKDKTRVSVWQEKGDKLDMLKWKYSKEEVPAWNKVEVNGTIIWDKTPTYNFFYENVVAPLQEKLSVMKTPNLEFEGSYNDLEDTGEDVNPDDIPF